MKAKVKYCISLFSCFTLFILVSCEEVKVENDGPVVNGFPVTLTATYVPSTNNLNKTYTYKWRDTGDILIITGEIESNKTTVSWEADLRLGIFHTENRLDTVTVDVYVEDQREKVATGFTVVSITRYLIGEIIVSQNNKTLSNDTELVSAVLPTDLLLKLHNSSGFLNQANIHYMWIVNFKQIYGPFSSPNKTLNLTLLDPYRIQCQVSAYFRQEDQKWLYLPGLFERTLTAKKPITHLNITGNFFLKHGEILDLEVACDGTESWTYCWKYYTGNHTVANESCGLNTTTNTCHFPIIHYFSKPETYTIVVLIDNGVSSIARGFVVNVYDVDRKPQLSTVIVPVSCTLVAVILVILGIAFYLQTRSRLNIEVADFDFGAHNGTDGAEPRGFGKMLKDDFDEWLDGVMYTFRRQENRVRTVTDRLRNSGSDKSEDQLSNT